jgi:transglutaminase-like putative cysteine protease
VLRLRSAFGILFLFCAGFSVQAGPEARRSAESPAQRAFSFTYEARVPANALSAANPHLWIPLPQSDAHQQISGMRIESNVRYARGRDPFYGDGFAMFTPTANEAQQGFTVVLRFRVIRREYRVNVDRHSLQDASLILPKHDRMIQRYLEPDTLVPLNAAIAELAKEQTAGATTPLEKARRIYDYVATTMRYDKSGQGWGRGDEMWACASKRGNCTDFHSVVIGMLRSSGIPARFEIGFPLPDGENRGVIAGYHCWVEFYLNGEWIPVDASEASQYPAKRDYYFGAVDANRVMFTYGRDIQLSAIQKGGPLNYFIYPYAEADGKPVKGVEARFSFRDLPAQSAASLGR